MIVSSAQTGAPALTRPPVTPAPIDEVAYRPNQDWWEVGGQRVSTADLVKCPPTDGTEVRYACKAGSWHDVAQGAVAMGGLGLMVGGTMAVIAPAVGVVEAMARGAANILMIPLGPGYGGLGIGEMLAVGGIIMGVAVAVGAGVGALMMNEKSYVFGKVKTLMRPDGPHVTFQPDYRAKGVDLTKYQHAVPVSQAPQRDDRLKQILYGKEPSGTWWRPLLMSETSLKAGYALPFPVDPEPDPPATAGPHPPAAPAQPQPSAAAQPADIATSPA